MPSPDKKVLHAYLTPEEYEQVRLMAEKSGLSISTFVKRVCLGQELRSNADQEAVRALLQANADLGRLGGLFKMALSEGKAGALAFDFRQTLRQIEKGQAQVTAHCRGVADSFRRGRRS